MPETRLEQLRAKLAARDKVPGYEKNCEAIRAEIARIEAGKPPTVTGQEFDL